MSKTLYFNGQIITVNDAQPTAEAVLVEDGVIIGVGNLAELEEKADGAQRVNLKGHTMTPGFIDGHSHMTMSGMIPRFDGPPAGDIDSVDKLVEAVKKYIEAHPLNEGQWFAGMGYDNASFPDHRHPTRYDLDKVSTEFPIVIMHASGHVGCVNSKALELLGITKDTPNPDGGVIQKDPVSGEPTGMLEEAAIIGKTTEIMPNMMTPEFVIGGILRGQEMYLSNGVTTAQDGSFEQAVLPVLQHMRRQNLLKIDLYVYPRIDEPSVAVMEGVESKTAEYVDGVKLAGVKFFLDGSPQAKTAWLTKPYYVVPEGEDESYCAYPVYESDDKVCDYFKKALKNKWQILVHCNGDAAIDQFINQYERAQKETGIFEDFRPVVIHCQTVREDQLDRMQELGMRPSFFHDHTFFWGDWHMDSVLGPERGKRISPLASAEKRGMPFTLHQDTPVVPPNMILTLHNAVNRKTKSGRDIGTEFCVEPIEALRGITLYGALQCFEEAKKGSIEVGKLADFVILDQNPLTIAKEKIKEIKVLQTIKQGQVVYDAE